MDPWLEDPAIFPDFHQSYLTYLGDALNAVLPEPYIARGATRVWIDDDQRREPDIGVFESGTSPPRVGQSSTLTAYTQLGLLELEALPNPDPFTEPYIEIRATNDDRLVTVIELLSVANKTPGGTNHGAYRQKQAELRQAGVSLVELDLLRSGIHTTAAPLHRLKAIQPHSYHICISAADIVEKVFVAPIRLMDPLPRVAIPLDAGVPPVMVELQPLLDQAYTNRRYGRQIQYGRPPVPPLTAEQQAWAEELLRTKGLLPRT